MNSACIYLIPENKIDAALIGKRKIISLVGSCGLAHGKLRAQDVRQE
jgi:hypothetical protein